MKHNLKSIISERATFIILLFNHHNSENLLQLYRKKICSFCNVAQIRWNDDFRDHLELIVDKSPVYEKMITSNVPDFAVIAGFRSSITLLSPRLLGALWRALEALQMFNRSSIAFYLVVCPIFPMPRVYATKNTCLHVYKAAVEVA
jgi:hypothetical protein